MQKIMITILRLPMHIPVDIRWKQKGGSVTTPSRWMTSESGRMTVNVTLSSSSRFDLGLGAHDIPLLRRGGGVPGTCGGRRFLFHFFLFEF